MRWQGQELGVADAAALPGLENLNGLVRSVSTPEFAGVTFHEVMCKSALNHVPGASAMPFDWTVNPYRGCTHACTYCFARGTHEYLDLDAGRDFDTQIVVKINVADVLQKELRRGTWQRDPVMLGTNTDPYQRAEGRYRLMPEIVGALTESGTPFSILTKGTLLRRDLPLLQDAAASVRVSLAMSIAVFDDALQSTRRAGHTVGRRQARDGAGGDRGRLPGHRVPDADPAAPDRLDPRDRRRAQADQGCRGAIASSTGRCTCGPERSSGSCSGCGQRASGTRLVVPRAVSRCVRDGAEGLPLVARQARTAAACACTASTAMPRMTTVVPAAPRCPASPRGRRSSRPRRGRAGSELRADQRCCSELRRDALLPTQCVHGSVPRHGDAVHRTRRADVRGRRGARGSRA